MRGIGLLCFVLSLPAFAALGHDLYVTYQDQDFLKPMMFSNIGYIWTHYSPETYIWAMKNISPDIWTGFVAPFLRFYTVLAAAAPAVLVFVVAGTLKIFNLPPFREISVGRGFKKGQFGFKNADPSKSRIKYKRK